jgi:hypothetical protein
VTRTTSHYIETDRGTFVARRGMIRWAKAIERAGGDDGIIQAWDMVRLFPGQPELHTTTFLATALAAAGFIREEDV